MYNYKSRSLLRSREKNIRLRSCGKMAWLCNPELPRPLIYITPLCNRYSHCSNIYCNIKVNIENTIPMEVLNIRQSAETKKKVRNFGENEFWLFRVEGEQWGHSPHHHAMLYRLLYGGQCLSKMQVCIKKIQRFIP